jgi:lysine 2,3-aminomutase
MAEEWQKILSRSVIKPSQVKEMYPELSEEEVTKVTKVFPMRITPNFQDLMEDEGVDGPIAQQVIPHIDELLDTGPEDPLDEEAQSPVPGLTHRYPDRVLFYVAFQCPIYCRYCTRKRKVGDPRSVSRDQIHAGLEYIRQHPEVRDVILSGGDPLVLKDEQLDYILTELRKIPHVEIIRIGTRVPTALPQRITENLCAILKKHQPVYIMAHFDHPKEITDEVVAGCGRLAESGSPIMNQTVLLRGVNDDPETMKRLMQRLLYARVRPYYIYQADLTRGTEHFRTNVARGMEIMKALRGHTSGLAVPYYIIDAPGGGGKVPVLPRYVEEINDREVVMRNYRGNEYRYPLPEQEISVEPAFQIAYTNGTTRNGKNGKH